jgi:hypothetical protein
MPQRKRIPVMSLQVWRMFAGVPVRDGENTRALDFTVTADADASTLGRYLADLGRVKQRRLTPDEFADRWSDVVVDGARLEDRAAHALEVERRRGPEPGAERYRRVVSWGRP